jgi:hypothetical protein
VRRERERDDFDPSCETVSQQREQLLQRQRALYRLAFGQPRQEDLLSILDQQGYTDDDERLARLRIDLRPPTPHRQSGEGNGHDQRRSVAANQSAGSQPPARPSLARAARQTSLEGLAASHLHSFDEGGPSPHLTPIDEQPDADLPENTAVPVSRE